MGSGGTHEEEKDNTTNKQTNKTIPTNKQQQGEEEGRGGDATLDDRTVGARGVTTNLTVRRFSHSDIELGLSNPSTAQPDPSVVFLNLSSCYCCLSLFVPVVE